MCGLVQLGWVAESWSGHPRRRNAGGTNSDAGGIGIGDRAQLRSPCPAAQDATGVSTSVKRPVANGAVAFGSAIRIS